MSKYSTNKQYGQSLTNYTNRDFNSIKQNLIKHIQSYFPQAYKDFNETSPGMMLLELSAYVGDVLNYYVDDSFKELLLPLSEDRRNIINLSKVTGYKPRAVVPSYVDLEFTLTVDADTTDIGNIVPTESQKITIDKGASVSSINNQELIFETLEQIDFTVDTNNELEKFIIDEVDADTGLASSFKSTRTVKAVSGQSKTITFNVGAPEQYKKLTIPDTDVIEIISCKDSNGNSWYEVDYLAQENVAIDRFYGLDTNRAGALETNIDGSTIVPSSLSFIKTTKRFTTEVNEDNTTSLIFGNGIIKNGKSYETTFLELEQEGVNLPTTVFSPKPLDAKIGSYYESLGEAPQNITLTITYRAGGGLNTAVPPNNLTNINSVTTIPAGGTTTNLTVNNNDPAVGGKDGDGTEEIRHGALANYATQNRCVTKEDYEARTISMPPKFGSIAKVYCTTGGLIEKNKQTRNVEKLKNVLNTIMHHILDGAESKSSEDLQAIDLSDPTLLNIVAGNGSEITQEDKHNFLQLFESLSVYENDEVYNPTIDLYILSYDVNGKLIAPPTLIQQNVKNYLNQFKLLTDKIRILPGFVVNFGVAFDVMTFPGNDKSVIKNRCIDAIKEIFKTDNMQFKQVLYTADVVTELNKLEGVKAVNDVVFTQDTNFLDNTSIFSPPLYSKSINIDGDIISINENKYGHIYDFSQFFDITQTPAGRGVVLPSIDPSIFEIKNPNTDIKGVVR